jgi:hypothetical protein
MASVDALFLEGRNEVLQEVASHVETVAGPVATVLRDPAAAAGAPPIDVLVVDPTPARPYRTLVTAGMSARASTAPVGWGDCRYAELALALPRDWPWPPGPQSGGWPVDLLRSVARVPQVFGGWLWLDHTVTNGDPPRPYAPDSPLCAVVLRRVALLGPHMARVRRADGESAWILAVVPLHADELALDRREGAAALGAALDRARVTELLDPQRPSAAALARALAPTPEPPRVTAPPPAPAPPPEPPRVTAPASAPTPAAPTPAGPTPPAPAPPVPTPLSRTAPVTQPRPLTPPAPPAPAAPWSAPARRRKRFGFR